MRRMLDEQEVINLIEEHGGGGTEYTAGTGIEISAENEITANIKAGSGIVIDTDLTDDSIVVMVDQEDIPYKSDLATVATTGDYDDLLNKPTIPAAQVNADWNASSGVAEILNKPTIPDAVSGTNDGTNWTSLTIGNDTYGIPAGGSGSKYLHKVTIYLNSSGSTYIWREDIIISSATAYTSVSSYLTDRGYTITASSDQPTKSFVADNSLRAIAYRSGQGYYSTNLHISSSGTVTYNNWGILDGTPSITDEVIPL